MCSLQRGHSFQTVKTSDCRIVQVSCLLRLVKNWRSIYRSRGTEPSLRDVLYF